jgi:hypothetical protein
LFVTVRHAGRNSRPPTANTFIEIAKPPKPHQQPQKHRAQKAHKSPEAHEEVHEPKDRELDKNKTLHFPPAHVKQMKPWREVVFYEISFKKAQKKIERIIKWSDRMKLGDSGAAAKSVGN